MPAFLKNLPIRVLVLILSIVHTASYADDEKKTAEVIINAPGLEDAAVNNARFYMQLASETCDTPRWKVSMLFGQVEQQVTTSLHAFGYYHPVISKQIKWEENCWKVTVDIEHGEPVIIESVDIKLTGATDNPKLNELAKSVSELIGKRLLHQQYEAVKKQLSDTAYGLGYLDAALEKKELRIYPDNNTAEIVLHLNTGELYYVGELKYEQSILDDDFLHRLADIKTGEPLKSASLISMQRKIADSGYFTSADVLMLRDQVSDYLMPIDVKLIPRKKHAWSAGIGVQSDTGVRVTGGYDNRLVNRRGHQWGSSLSLSQVETELNANYMIPGSNPHKEKYNLGFSLKHEDVDTYETDSLTLDVHQTLKSPGWTEVRSLQLLYEDYTVAGESNDDLLFMPGISWVHEKVDNPFKVHSGYRVGLSLKGALEGFLSTESLLQSKISAKMIYRFGDAGRITARGEFGATYVEDIKDIPASLRFFAGGDNSVRGYDYESLGPTDNNGEVIGGTNLITASIEYEHPVIDDNWWAALFVDAGNAFDFDNSNVDMKIGYGAGVRWFSPFGRFKIDLAVPEEGSFSDLKLHFAFGTDL
jgi:translocation and assembly module TamA